MDVSLYRCDICSSTTIARDCERIIACSTRKSKTPIRFTSSLGHFLLISNLQVGKLWKKTPTLGDPSSSLFGAATPHPSLLRFLCCIRSQSIDPAADATGGTELHGSASGQQGTEVRSWGSFFNQVDFLHFGKKCSPHCFCGKSTCLTSKNHEISLFTSKTHKKSHFDSWLKWRQRL